MQKNRLGLGVKSVQQWFRKQIPCFVSLKVHQYIYIPGFDVKKPPSTTSVFYYAVIFGSSLLISFQIVKNSEKGADFKKRLAVIGVLVPCSLEMAFPLNISQPQFFKMTPFSGRKAELC